MAAADLDLDRLVEAWESREPYDGDVTVDPWDQPDAEAFNSVGAGWACRIGPVVLVEQADGQHRSLTFPSEADAVANWPTYEASYGEVA